MCYSTLCLSGGGINGFNILGSLKYLIDLKILKIQLINNFIGTSIGSLINLLLIINFKINDVIKIMYKLNLDKISINYDIDNFFENYGFNNCSEILSIIQTLLNDKLNKYDLTLIEFYKITKKKFNIIVVNFTDRKEEIINYENNPNMSLILALRMSISIPLVFYPVKYQNKIYIDGGIINNFGFNYCNSKKTLGICFMTNYKTTPNNIFEFIQGIYSILQKNSTLRHLKDPNHFNIIHLRNNLVEAISNINNKTKLKLLKKGYKQTKIITQKNLNFISIKYINKIIEDVLKINF